MLETSLEAQFAKLGPWTSKFLINGVAYGGDYDAVNDPRLSQFLQSFPHARRVLELGSLECGHTIGLSTAPRVEEIVAVEGRESNLRKAKFILKLQGSRKIKLVKANLEKKRLASLGRFDAVFCVGLLYHLPRPWQLLEQIAQVSTGLFLWTHFAREDRVDVRGGPYEGWRYPEGGRDEPLSGLSSYSFWPTMASLESMLRDCGFNSLTQLEVVQHHVNGPCVTLVARRQ